MYYMSLFFHFQFFRLRNLGWGIISLKNTSTNRHIESANLICIAMCRTLQHLEISKNRSYCIWRGWWGRWWIRRSWWQRTSSNWNSTHIITFFDFVCIIFCHHSRRRGHVTMITWRFDEFFCRFPVNVQITMVNKDDSIMGGNLRAKSRWGIKLQ